MPLLLLVPPALQQRGGHAPSPAGQIECPLVNAPFQQHTPVQRHQIGHQLLPVAPGVDRALLLAAVHQLPQHPEVHARFVIPQDLQFGGLRVYDAVMAGRVARFGIQPGADDRAAVDAALEDMELTALAQRNVQQLSGGERQKVAIARALAQEPRLLVFDEPTGNLDVANEQRILRHARRLARTRGITVLCTLHDLNQALQCGDRLFLMQDGCIKYTGGGDILTPETVQEIFGARVRAAVIDGKKYLIGADDDEE